MSRSVVLNGTVRCPRCEQTPRWCICAGLRTVDCPLQVDVLLHYTEAWRPTSTSHVIQRTLPTARCHRWYHREPLTPEQIRVPGKELWILHPQGDELPATFDVASVQVLLLDGTWTQAGDMMRATLGWGRHIRLPMAGKSRYWLRAQQPDAERFSTIEALLFLLSACGLQEVKTVLQAQFELHVYAGLRTRGRLAEAEAYLRDSPVRDAFPEVLAALHVTRPRRPVPRKTRPESPPSDSCR